MYIGKFLIWQSLPNLPCHQKLKTSPKFPAIRYVVLCMCIDNIRPCSITADVICITGNVRLVGGSNPLEGRLEMCYFNQWGTICSSNMTSQVAQVACRQLGYAGSMCVYRYECIHVKLYCHCDCYFVTACRCY